MSELVNYGGGKGGVVERIKHVDDLRKLDLILGEQLKLYARKCGEGYEQSSTDFYSTYQSRQDWLNHTIYVFKSEIRFYDKYEIYHEVVKWCVEWIAEWILPYVSPGGEKLNTTFQEPSPTRDLIFSIINSVDNKGWEYAFRSENDLNTFTELLTCYFEQREYVITPDIIRLRKGSQTQMATRIKEIHKELSDRPLKGDDAFFDIVRKLYPFNEIRNLYKTISR